MGCFRYCRFVVGMGRFILPYGLAEIVSTSIRDSRCISRNSPRFGWHRPTLNLGLVYNRCSRGWFIVACCPAGNKLGRYWISW